jgi:murein DD-endopeptidase MepM/ murein hydrolase activator NlpD
LPLLLLLFPAAAPAAFVDPTNGIEEIQPQHTALFPIDGPHDLGRNPANRFGGGRGHDGQDMFADCGTPVRAAQAGRVVFAGYQGAAGNYIVIRSEASGEDQAYMHLLNTPRLAAGDRVEMGQRIASVGRTGRADGCHLHFELWTAPGWYRGGAAYDPLGKLRLWDSWS